MGGLKKYLPVTYLTFLTGVLAISGIPPFAGFFSKDEILASAFEHNKIIWGLAVLASLLTVFYMFRLLFLTFFGTARASHDTMHHIHESGDTITAPLIALAILSVVGGFMGVPEVLGGSHWLNGFLAPVFASSQELVETHHLAHSTEYILMGVVVALTVIMIAFAYLRYVNKRHLPVAEGHIVNPLQRVLYNKYYIDQLYDGLIVRPWYWISGKLDTVIEQLGIDRLVNSSGNSVVAGSKVARLLQNGRIGYYIFVMVISIVLILVLGVVKR